MHSKIIPYITRLYTIFYYECIIVGKSKVSCLFDMKTIYNSHLFMRKLPKTKLKMFNDDLLSCLQYISNKIYRYIPKYSTP